MSKPGPGHNTVGGIDQPKFKAYLDRIETLNAEKHSLSLDVSDLYKKAKGDGFDTKAMREVIRLRMMDAEKREERDETLRLYRAAAGIDPFS